MKEMIRMKLTTPKGHVFLSPFVFDRKEAKKRARSATKSLGAKRVELLNVTNYPPDAAWSAREYGGHVMSIRTLLKCAEALEDKWKEVEKNAYSGEDVEEMEEGSSSV